jgi:hypothetical protein
VYGDSLTDLSAFQVGDGLGHACSVRVSRLFWVSTADVKLLEYSTAVPGYKGRHEQCSDEVRSVCRWVAATFASIQDAGKRRESKTVAQQQQQQVWWRQDYHTTLVRGHKQASGEEDSTIRFHP